MRYRPRLLGHGCARYYTAPFLLARYHARLQRHPPSTLNSASLKAVRSARSHAYTEEIRMWSLVLLLLGFLGLSLAEPEKRIISGKVAQNGDIPWLVGFHFNYVRNPPIFCGGALIDDVTVVTAAHCFKASKKPRDYTVIIGEGSVSRIKAEHKFKVSRITVHPRYMYNYPDKTNDIAIVKLSRKVRMSSSVKPIDLPSGPKDKAQEGTSCLAGGWGKTEVASTSWTLFKTQIKIRAIAACKKEYYGIIWSKPERQLCAGGLSFSNVCTGDSGGPLACKRKDGRFVLEGAVSFGNKYCGPTPIKFPVVFTRIGSFIDWIKYNY